jgi:hypothetical protein
MSISGRAAYFRRIIMAKMYYPLITSFMIFYLLSTECFGAVEPVLLAYTIDGRFYKQLGSSLAGVGDINGDGFDDIACGAAGYLIEKDSKGNGYIFWGRRTKFNGMPDIVMEGENFYDEFGYAL